MAALGGRAGLRKQAGSIRQDSHGFSTEDSVRCVGSPAAPGGLCVRPRGLHLPFARLVGWLHRTATTSPAPSCVSEAGRRFLHVSVLSRRGEPYPVSHRQELQLPCIPNQELATCEELLWLEGTGKEPAFSYKGLSGTKYEWCFTNTGERGTEMVVQPAGSAQPAQPITADPTDFTS